MPSQDVNAIAALVAALRGGPCVTNEADHLVDLAEANGVEALLARAAWSASAPPVAAARLQTMMAGYEAMSALRDRELTRVLDALAAGGISPVLIKGAHLAHTIYPSPAWRPREDTDFVIAEEEQASTASLLTRAGYRPRIHVRGTMILGQRHFQRLDGLGIVHALDAHWRLAAPLVFRHTLPIRALRESRVPIPGLGPHAWGPSLPHALIVACVHLVAHHRADPILLWLYDIARLAALLDHEDAGTFIETAGAAGISAVCASALDRAREYFDGPALASLAVRAHAGSTARAEPSARLLTATRRIDEMWLDLRIADGWRERMSLLREHLWPDAAYMRATSAPAGWLPLAYARRAALGIRKWAIRSG